MGHSRRQLLKIGLVGMSGAVLAACGVSASPGAAVTAPPSPTTRPVVTPVSATSPSPLTASSPAASPVAARTRLDILPLWSPEASHGSLPVTPSPSGSGWTFPAEPGWRGGYLKSKQEVSLAGFTSIRVFARVTGRPNATRFNLELKREGTYLFASGKIEIALPADLESHEIVLTLPPEVAARGPLTYIALSDPRGGSPTSGVELLAIVLEP